MKGTRRTLDDAVRAAGVDPGGRPVRERAISAAASLISERGLAAVTLEDVATAAGCSAPSLYLAFESRDGLLAAVFTAHLPLADLENFLAAPPGTRDTVRTIHGILIHGLSSEPRVFPAILADLLARPTGPGQRIWSQQVLPRLTGSVGTWLAEEVRSGRFKPLPLPVLAHLLIGPPMTHMLFRPTLVPMLGTDLPTVDQAIDAFTDAFLSAVTAENPAPDSA
ncbi:TetR/AcrR family transcriptional regulator [Actinomadura sp. KC345]|uniref:TetR/AcrR family transcriptional regulator n=1 Tax=Actinomadura sp. KC345 TaxID=2530371 RepID=UPI001FB7A7F8|nr:TetR/AcrR family transcriptional regulator [Actinomadura sp. KC345]